MVLFFFYFLRGKMYIFKYEILIKLRLFFFQIMKRLNYNGMVKEFFNCFVMIQFFYSLKKKIILILLIFYVLKYIYFFLENGKKIKLFLFFGEFF